MVTAIMGNGKSSLGQYIYTLKLYVIFKGFIAACKPRHIFVCFEYVIALDSIMLKYFCVTCTYREKVPFWQFISLEKMC